MSFVRAGTACLNHLTIRRVGRWLTLAALCAAPRLHSAAVKYLDTATILLPHMLLETIRFGSDRDRACILTELMSVLSYEPDGDRPGAAGVKVTPMAQMCTQTVFWLLDSLHAWIDKQSQPIPRERVRASRPSGSVSSIGTAVRLVHRRDAFRQWHTFI